MLRRITYKLGRSLWRGFNNFLADDLSVAIYLLFITAAGIGAAWAQFQITTGALKLW